MPDPPVQAQPTAPHLGARYFHCSPLLYLPTIPKLYVQLRLAGRGLVGAVCLVGVMCLAGMIRPLSAQVEPAAQDTAPPVEPEAPNNTPNQPTASPGQPPIMRIGPEANGKPAAESAADTQTVDTAQTPSAEDGPRGPDSQRSKVARFFIPDPQPYPHPGYALRWSLVLPGAGQIYNKSYWKLPIVYGALGASIYFIVFNQREYVRFGNAYRAAVDSTFTNPNPDPSLAGVSSTSLRANRDFHRNNRDLSILLGVLAYTLTAVEAYVHAHLKPFDVSDDLSLQVAPTLAPGGAGPLRPQAGVRLSLALKR